jgi:hypothetical protein
MKINQYHFGLQLLIKLCAGTSGGSIFFVFSPSISENFLGIFLNLNLPKNNSKLTFQHVSFFLCSSSFSHIFSLLLVPIMALITPLPRRPYNAPETVSEEKTNVLIHQQIALTEWIYALVDVHIICNHIEIRRLLGLPKYAHRL